MAVNTYLLDFDVDVQKISNGHGDLEAKIIMLLKKYVHGLSVVERVTLGDGGFLTLCTGNREIFATIRMYVQGLLTVNLEHYKKAEEDYLFDETHIISMVEEIAKALDSQRCQGLPAIKRGTVQRYFTTSDAKLYELDSTRVLFEEKSPYQLVQVLESVSLGNILVLNGAISIAVKDVIYTQTMMQRGKEMYQDKDIFIIGGGDGALLWQILQENPKSVLVLELDEVVVRACRTHMREANGGILDKLEGPNYKIVIGDYAPYLKQFLKQGQRFDYVFGDLTDFHFAQEDGGSEISGLPSTKDIINLSFKLLKPMGKCMCYCDGTVRHERLKVFENILQESDEPLTFSKDAAFVPSFMEFWQSYQIRRQTQKSGALTISDQLA